MKRIAFCVAAVLMMGVAVQANSVSFKALSDGEIIQAEAGYQMGKVEYGAWGRWHEDDPHAVNGLGAYALLTVDPNLEIPLSGLFPYVGTALKLPEKVTGTVKVGFGGGVVNFDEPDAVVYPMVDVQFGPLLVRVQYDWVDSGGFPGYSQSEGRVTLGIAYPF
jgi:hypothetical protein